jgi:integrase
VPLNERVRAAIADYLVSLQAVPQGPVFRSRVGNGKPITRMQAFRLVKGLAHEAGLDAERVGCHSARKTFASQIHRAAKYDLLKAQRILGHSSPLVTARYLDTDRDELDTLVLGLGQATVQVVATGMALTGTSDRTAEGYVTHSL